MEDIKEIILDLDSSHYDKGPEPDTDNNKKGDIWFFIYPFNNIDIYIKLRIDVSNEVVCISFHEEGEY